MAKTAVIAVPVPPSHLSKRSQSLWRELVPSRARSTGRLTLLQVGLEALDRLSRIQSALDGAELTTTTKETGAVHLNPLLKAEKDARSTFVRAWTALSLAWDSDLDGVRLEQAKDGHWVKSRW